MDLSTCFSLSRFLSGKKEEKITIVSKDIVRSWLKSFGRAVPEVMVECLYSDNVNISVECAKSQNLLTLNSSGQLLHYSSCCLYSSFLHAADSVVTWENSSVLTDSMPSILHREIIV